MKVQYRVCPDPENDDVYEPESEIVEITSGDSVIDGRKDMHTWDFQDYGHKPTLVLAGQCIDIRVWGVGPSEGRRFHYIHGGYERHYSNIEGQEFHWTTKYSDWNRNSTDSDWGFLPGILYAPV